MVIAMRREETRMMAGNPIRRLVAEDEAGRRAGWVTLDGASRTRFVESSTLHDAFSWTTGQAEAQGGTH